MKLHLPKALLVAVLSVFTALSASAFGPTDVTYTEVTGDVNSAQTPSADTFYSSVIGSFDISGSGYDIKLEGKKSNDEYVLGNITADSTWLSDSRFTINSSNRLAKAGDLYINGGACLQVLGEVALTNDITLGTSTYNGGWDNTYANIKNAALLLGYWKNTNKSVTISGALDVQEDARIALQYGYELNHTGKLTGSADLNISHYEGGDKSSTVTLSGETDYTGNISLTGYSGAVLTLKLTTNTFKLQTEAASIAVGSNTVLDLSGYSLSNFQSINNNTGITTTGSGYILLAKSTSTSEITLPGNSDKDSEDAVNITSINKNYKVEGSLDINGAGYKKNDGRTRTLIVGDDRSFVTTGALSLVSNAVLKIEGGTVQAGSIALGHGGVYSYPYWGKIEMSGGSLKTGTITMQRSYANVVDISGGTLEFTHANAIEVASNRNSSVKIVGKDASNRVTLKTGSTAWHLNGTGLKEALVGNVTIDSNNVHAITLSNVQLSGNIVNNAQLILGEGVSIKSDDTVTLSGSSIGISCALTNNGTLVLDGAISATGYDYTGVDDSLVTYSDNGTDGFKVYQTGKEFYLVEGEGNTTITENCSFTFNGLAAEVVSENNKASFELKEDCTNETIYYVRTKDFTVDGTANNPAANATGYDVASGRTLTIAANQSDSMSASTILSTTTGGGNITLATSATMTSAAQAQGKLSIENGAVLTMDVGRDTDHTYLSSFSTIDLNGATIEYHGSNTTLNNVTVGEAGAGLHIKDMKDSSKVITFAGTTTLDGNLSIESYWRGVQTWKYGVNIENLTGSGDLTIKGTTHSNGVVNKVTAKLLSTYTGAITAERSTNNNSTTSVELTTAGDVSLKGLKLLKGATGKITATGTLGLGDVDLTGGSTLTIMNSESSRTTTMQSLDVTGQAVVQIERDNSCHNGTINIGALNGENATVTFRNGSYYTTNATAFNLNGGAFSGTINVEGNSAGSNDRNVELNLNSDTVAENAVIQFLNPTTSDTDNNNKITLGLGAAEVRVAGLSGETTNAAKVQATNDISTLVINTAEGASYTTNAIVENTVNLYKTGAGTQVFSADMSDYTGTIAVMMGELQLSAAVSAAELMHAGGVNVGSTGTLTHGHEGDGHISTAGKVELAAGATINGSITLNSGATLEMTGLGTVDRGITLNGELVIKDKQTFVTALSSYVKSRSGDSTIRIFSGLTGLTVGDYTFSAENNQVDLSTWDTTGSLTTENTYFITYDSDNGNVELSMGEMVPEPTTTTLSLLALSGLMLRRRRK